MSGWLPRGGTKLTYDVDADVAGKFPQLASRLIQGTASLIADHFFTQFGEVVAGPAWDLEADVAHVSFRKIRHDRYRLCSSNCHNSNGETYDLSFYFAVQVFVMSPEGRLQTKRRRKRC
jgi:hypothetical protein